MGALGAIALSALLLAPACSGDPEAAEASSTSTGSGSGGAGGAADTASAAETTTSSTTTTSATGGAMIACSDAYSNIPAGPCDLLQQDCEPGKSCRPQQAVGGYTTKCYSDVGLKGPAEACTADNECQAGLFCIADQCRAICCPENDEPCNGGACNLNVSWAGSDSFTFMCSYSLACVLFTEDACPEGYECHLEDTQQGLVGCIQPSGQQVEEGGDCNFLNDCKDMQFCFGQNGEQNVCRYNCDLTTPEAAPGLGGCPAGQKCLENINFGIPSVSVCVPSQGA